MSLQHAAKHLAAHGRGKDTELIHMDKGEIASLQQIAKANGGSLTINPHTGLPEAGFLSAMLPMIAGAGLMLIPGMQAMGAAGIVGALQTARTGSLKQGIMAGLGAYGGAGLAGSAGTAGASQASINATNQGASAVQGLEATEAAQAAAKIAIPQGASAVPTALQTTGNVAAGATGTGGSLASSNQAFNAATQGNINGLTTTPAESFGATNPNAGIQAAQPVQAAGGPQYNIDGMGLSSPTATPTATPSSFADTTTASQRLNAMKEGASFSNAADWAGNNKMAALGAATSVAAGMQKDPLKPAEPDKDMGQRYSFTGSKLEPTPAPDVPTYEDMLTKQGNYGRQQRYFNSPTYTAISPTAAKDLYNFAGGGMPVEQMSNQAAMGANTMYPMANMATSSFATPYQSPVSTNMLAPTSDSGVTMSGEPSMQGTRMAEGGEAEESRPSYTYDPQARKYIGGPSMGGASSAPQDFGASAAAALDNFSAGVARDGLTTPMGSYIPPSRGIPSYAYNPQTQQYMQQMAGGGIASYRIGGDLDIQDAPDDRPVGPIGRLLGMTRRREQDANPGLGYMYNQDDQQYVQQQASGGLSDARYNLGGYSDGGRLLRGPGDGVSDSIPAVIGKKQPARLADGEFVVPARIVSELGNGSTEAGARKLYAMMDRIQSARKKTVGKNKVAHNSRASKYLPA
jgi:hypothetical protein